MLICAVATTSLTVSILCYVKVSVFFFFFLLLELLPF